jgi:hypothetical protein
MICSFCGTDNREGNRFCGICGVRLERRRAERRVHDDSAFLKCEACGNVNEPGYKFCGMCGTRVDRRTTERRGTGVAVHSNNGSVGNVMVAPPETAAIRASSEQQSSTARERISDSSRHSPAGGPVFRSEPVERLSVERADRSGIHGPSFLGLSDEAEEDTSYLMEDEGSSGSGLRKLVLLVILAAIVGLIFVQYRSSLHANPKATPAAQPAPSGPQGQSQPSAAPPAAPDQSQTSPASQVQQGPQNMAPATADPASTAPPQDPGAGSQTPPAKSETLGPHMNPTDVAERTPDPPATDSKQESAATKTFDAPMPEEQKPSPLLVRAQQFLHGQGVEQNCEQGLLYLRAAAQKNEPAAAVQMGALYASGRCVHQDRVMAYRWFNSAHELEPANQWIQRNMDLLWGQMSQQERRLAGY